ncbi:MAG TPA: hypothetical protein DF613_08250, partial [Lachnospiraceae bacterium]|nr:hypothetical protein [Lachnospiraceae bacterium]
MKEIVLSHRKIGMPVLLGNIALYLLLLAGLIFSVFNDDGSDFPVGVIACIVLMAIAWIPLMGLHVLKPQEALVLT